MKLKNIKIENFKGIKYLNVDLEDVNVFIGENNSGKTSLLDSLTVCFWNRKFNFNYFDFYLSQDQTERAPIKIELTFMEDEDDWHRDLVKALSHAKVLGVDRDKSFVKFRIVGEYDSATKETITRYEFLDKEGNPFINHNESAAFNTIHSYVNYYYLAALRDAKKHFHDQGQFWKPLLKENELTQEQKNDIENRVKEINDMVVASNTNLRLVQEQISKVQNVVSVAAGDIVSVEAIPGKVLDLISKTQMYIATATGVKIPITRHGEGTQSISVLMLFSAFLNTMLGRTSIIALEEPEAHLHPSGVRDVWNLIDNLNGQKIVTTHSGDLLSEVPIYSIRRLVTRKGITKCFRIHKESLEKDEERKINYHIRYARGELLFANCWLLVEGETEIVILTEVAKILKLNLERAGVRLVTHRHAGIEVLLKVARDLGIKTCVMFDGDFQGSKDMKVVQTYFDEDEQRRSCFKLNVDNIECYLCVEGFGDVYLASVSPQLKHKIKDPPGGDDYWRQVVSALPGRFKKPNAALEVVEMMRADHERIPKLFRDTLNRAIELAGEV